MPDIPHNQPTKTDFERLIDSLYKPTARVKYIGRWIRTKHPNEFNSMYEEYKEYEQTTDNPAKRNTIRQHLMCRLNRYYPAD